MTDSLLQFTDKWLAASTEQSVLAVFVPQPVRLRHQAWAALHFELFECLFALEHEVVRVQKSLWWAEELQRLQNDTARHPITQALSSAEAPYAGMISPMLELARQVPIIAGDTAGLIKQLTPMACAIDVCEAALFKGRDSDNSTAIVMAWLSMRLPAGLAGFDRAMLPMHLRARYQTEAADTPGDALKRDWISELLAAFPNEPAGNWFREAQRRFTRRRLLALRSQSVPGIVPGHAWDAWRAMRRYQP
jgi:hypothetical protein